MTPSPQRADAPASADQLEPLELTEEQFAPVEPTFDSGQWEEKKGAEGRQVLGVALTIIAVIWLAFTAWAAGQTLAAQSLSAPQFAQWIAIGAGPLALVGLAWLMFGRTRRKEAEHFTRSVVLMRHEARSLEALLEVLSQRINDSRSELVTMSRHLMELGDDATGKLGGITREFDSSSLRLRQHGDALDRAAEAARNDLAVLLDDLPRAEQTARTVAEHLRAMGTESLGKSAELGRQVDELSQRAQNADAVIGEAVDRLSARLAEVDNAASSAVDRTHEAHGGLAQLIDALLGRTSATLDEIRHGIDTQSAAVTALVAQAQAGIGRAGAEAAETLASNVDHANSSLEGLASRVAEQDRASQRMIAEIDRGLALIDERFAQLAANGDERANSFLQSLTRARAELDALAGQASSQDDALGSLAERTASVRESIDQLVAEIRDGASIAIGEAQWGADRLTQSASELAPELRSIRDAVVEAADKLTLSGAGIGEHQQRFAALVGIIDNGVEESRNKLAELSSGISQAEREAASLSAETAPALVAALLQVREAASHAAQRAREAIEQVIPEAAGKLSSETRDALERVIRESVEERLKGVETVASRAVDSARAASDRLTQQMLTLGQTASALEAHIEQTSREQREKDSEAFARRVSLLIDSMNSAAIDVGKILSDEIDDKAWGAYLKGNRGVFTSRAVRLIGASETRAIRAHYDIDIEFQRSVNRYVADFESMLRRVLAERDGPMIAVTLMSSDMGKLYAALNQAIDKLR